MAKYTKSIDGFTIVADHESKSRGYFAPNGAILRKENIWRDDVFYEQDYFHKTYLRNLHVIDSGSHICTPIIQEIDVENSGYVMTFSSTFWVQGFAIIKSDLYFISIGEDTGYYAKKPVFHKLTPGYDTRLMTYNEFIKTLPDPVADTDMPRETGLMSLMYLSSIAAFIL